MKKIIKGKTYNTDTASPVAARTEGAFGDPAGYEEQLYKTKKGLYFIHGRGGQESPYPQETIRPITEGQAREFQGK
jgi:hypothetical protein